MSCLQKHYPQYIVMCNDIDSKYVKSECKHHWNEWTGLFYGYDADRVEDHMRTCFPFRKHKEYAFAIFIKEEFKKPWKFVKRIK